MPLDLLLLLDTCKAFEYESTFGEKFLLSYSSKLPEISRAALIKFSWKTRLSEIYLEYSKFI